MPRAQFCSLNGMLTSGWRRSCSGVSVGEIVTELVGADDDAPVQEATAKARLASSNNDMARRVRMMGRSVPFGLALRGSRLEAVDRVGQALRIFLRDLALRDVVGQLLPEVVQ